MKILGKTFQNEPSPLYFMIFLVSSFFGMKKKLGEKWEKIYTNMMSRPYNHFLELQ